MSKNNWVAGGVMWLLACGGNSGGGAMGTGDGGKPPTPEERRQQVQACILQRLPRPDGALEWEASGYVLVDAYVKCQEKPSDMTAADFRAVIQDLAHHVEGDPSRVRLTAPSGDSP